ncbi:LD-carboxypeptidase [Hymenobacter sp. BT770]|uniref:S66 peptidase family protein n=1 Tax=Hymenobacter sp. BT770 TaxID=2886942 RepID=UPI001D11B2CC|nr:LD-carboxypeptidase [Hymenobacter sp. BT770]MCC3154430.1 LD-carboxypeptidase [Hymenobacter sp. BT770]MDO3416301.1 LD-carboxypeptidase [Hymenobacter sp. BT770]
MSALFPPALQRGQRVAIVSPARKISAAELAPAIATLESWGLEVVLGDSIAGEHHQFAGNDDLRRRDFQQQLNDPSIRAILCARGGYGTARIVDGLDFSRFAQQPKWIAGFSDITVLNGHLLRLGYASIHGVMPVLFHQEGGERALESLRRALFGEPALPIGAPWHELNRPGTATGELVGGNLSLLHTVTGTASQASFEGRILFLEDLDEYLYHIDRMMLHLHRSGQLAGLAGLVVGHFSDMRDNAVPFGTTAVEIIDSYARHYNFPVGYGFPIGHEPTNDAVVVGQVMRLDVTDAGSTLEPERA